MAIDSQLKRMGAAGRVYPGTNSALQRMAIGNAYPVADISFVPNGIGLILAPGVNVISKRPSIKRLV